MQLVQYVLETAIFPDLYRYHDKVRRRRLEYDDRFRRPVLPPGATEVPCENTERIGVTYYLRRPARNLWTQYRVRFQWVHAAVAEQDDDWDHFHWVHFAQGQQARIESESIAVDGALKRDGLLTVRASVDGEPLWAANFNLTGCDAPQ